MLESSGCDRGEPHQQFRELLTVDDVAQARTSHEAPQPVQQRRERSGSAGCRHQCVRAADQRVRQDSSRHFLAQRGIQLGVELLQQIDEPAPEMPAAAIHDCRECLCHDRDGHAEREQNHREGQSERQLISARESLQPDCEPGCRRPVGRLGTCRVPVGVDNAVEILLKKRAPHSNRTGRPRARCNRSADQSL